MKGIFAVMPRGVEQDDAKEQAVAASSKTMFSQDQKTLHVCHLFYLNRNLMIS